MSSNSYKIKVTAVVDTMSADLLTPLAVYLKLAAAGNNSFLLESVEGGESLGRYSFIGVEPRFIARGNDRAVTVTTGENHERLEISMIEFLRQHFDKYVLEPDASLPGFSGGAIGIMGFACSAWFEPTLRAAVPRQDHEAVFMFCRRIVAFDHARQVVKIVSLVFADEAKNETELAELIEHERRHNNQIRNLLESASVTLPPPGRKTGETTVTSNFERADFEKAVLQIKHLIAAGDAYQVVLSQCFSRPTSVEPVAIYRAMRSINPSPYMFLIRLGGRSIIGSSPEMLVRSNGSQLEYRPIAGTRPRGADAVKDEELANEMRADAKEVAEHLMLVDLGRNDLGRVAEFGSVNVSGIMSVEKYSHVQHLVSYLSAKLRDRFDRFDALAACFPAGTVSGAPKVAAIEILSRLEPTPRGVYSGAVGYFDYSGNMDTCIAIRTMVLENDVATVQAGAGIVADSDPASEYQETINKAAALLRAIELAEGGNR
ncbi:MAG: anthranilate synthase component I family protein [Blastocatellia bacterium]|nr:anthranilate synthase component I family protein [Blastocatellia bacterium]